MEAYKRWIHRPADAMLTSACIHTGFAPDPNHVTISSLFLLAPILWCSSGAAGALCVAHDLTDRLDGSVARISVSKGIKRDGRFGATLDACCDKVFAVGMLALHPSVPLWATWKIAIHALGLATRITLHASDTKLDLRSTMHGKAGTFLENASFACLCWGWTRVFAVLFGVSCLLAVRSLAPKVGAFGYLILSAAVA